MSLVHTCSCSPAITTTREVPTRITYTWRIHNFNSVEAKEDEMISPPILTKDNKFRWLVLLKPNGKNPAKDTISLYFYLGHFSDCKEVFANCDAYILNNEEKPILLKSTQAQRFTVGEIFLSWGWRNFCNKGENFRTNVLSNNTLTLYFEIECSTKLSVVSESCNKKSLKWNFHECDLSENFAHLLETQAFSDVVLSTNGKDFPAHKLILTARSKVFAAMFQHDTKENQSNRIDIEDASEEIVEEMLRFIYTGKCEKLDELAEGLLVVADKYDLDRLKLICCNALCKTLSTENAANILILADLHNANELKTDVIEFIVSRASEVFSTAGWNDIIQSPKSQLIIEVFQSMARRLALYEVEAYEKA